MSAAAAGGGPVPVPSQAKAEVALVRIRLAIDEAEKARRGIEANDLSRVGGCLDAIEHHMAMARRDLCLAKVGSC